MSLKHIITKNAPAAPIPGLFAQAVRAGPFLYTQGTPGARPDGTMVEGTIADRTRQVIKNLEQILAAEGMTLNDVVKATIFIKNFDENFPSVKLNTESGLTLSAVLLNLKAAWLEGTLTKSLFVQFADNAVRGFDLLVNLFAAGKSDPRYMRIWQDVINAYNELQGFRSENGEAESARPQLVTLQRALQFRTVSVASDEPLCISTLMSLDTKYIAATSDTESRMIRTWELLSKLHGGLPPRLIFYADEMLSTPGWRWAPRSLLGSSVKDATIGFDERMLRLVCAPDALGIPTPLGLKVAFPGCRLVPLPLAAGLSLHPWPGAINPSEDQIIIHHDESGKWYRINDWYRSKKLSSWTDDERIAFDKEQNDPLCREIDSGKCILIYDERSRINDMLLACMALTEGIPKGFKHSSIDARELNTGLRVHRTRTVIMSLLSDDEVRMMKAFRDLAFTIAAYQETSNLSAINDRESEEWKNCMSSIKAKMREVVAEALSSNPQLVETIKNTIGTDVEEYMWAYIPKLFSHTISMKETSSEQIWFVD